MKKYHIGYTCGVFDLFHVGHLNLLERCKEMCDILIVGVCDDKYVTEIKKKQPVYSEDQRVRIINALKVVDTAELVSIEAFLSACLYYLFVFSDNYIFLSHILNIILETNSL